MRDIGHLFRRPVRRELGQQFHGTVYQTRHPHPAAFGHQEPVFVNLLQLIIHKEWSNSRDSKQGPGKLVIPACILQAKTKYPVTQVLKNFSFNLLRPVEDL